MSQGIVHHGELGDAILAADQRNKARNGDERPGGEGEKGRELFMTSEVVQRAQEKEKKAMEAFNLAKVSRDLSLAVPTNDRDVKLHLRSLGQAICLFGEDAFMRRERLKQLFNKKKEEKDKKDRMSDDEDEKEEVFYTEGSETLRKVRLSLAESSLLRGRAMLAFERKFKHQETEEAFIARENAFKAHYRERQHVMDTQVGDERPLSHCVFSPDPSLLATSGWSGDIGIWRSEGRVSSKIRKLVAPGNKDRCQGVAWHPLAGSGREERLLNLASASADGKVYFWPLLGNEEGVGSTDLVGNLGSLEGHEGKVNRVKFHNVSKGSLLGSTSDDGTWRLWDVETGEELLTQEGHARGVHDLVFHPAGSLCATSDDGGVVRLWDLRTGRSLLGLNEHAHSVTSLDFSPDGQKLASGSKDKTVKVWDLRKQGEAWETLLAHDNIVTAVRFEPKFGRYLSTCGFDGVVKLWSSHDYSNIKNLLIGPSQKIMHLDIAPNARKIVCASFNRTFSIFSLDVANAPVWADFSTAANA